MAKKDTATNPPREEIEAQPESVELQTQDLIIPEKDDESESTPEFDAQMNVIDVSPSDDDEEDKSSKGSSPSLPVKRGEKSIQRGSGDSSQLSLLQKYFKEIRQYPLLTKEEELELATDFHESQNPDLAFRLTTANLRLVVKIAMEYQSAVANLLDLIQEGNVGLMQAVKKFDPYKGIRLSSYAQWWIRAYILKYLVNNARLVKIGTTQAQRKLFFNLRKEKDRLEALGFKPEPALLAKNLDVREEEVKEMEQRLARSDLSLDMPLGDDQKSTVGDLMASEGADAEEQVIDSEFKNRLRAHMAEFAKTLKEREKILWEKRLTAEDQLTLQEIGNIFGVTRERARQIEKEMIKRFRDYLQKQLPDLDTTDLLPGA